MNREMLEMVEVLAQEKSVPREVVFGVLETALASAVKKMRMSKCMLIAIPATTEHGAAG